jgi:arabinogalactan oligomer/maltooligosaccharide transport system permease protein
LVVKVALMALVDALGVFFVLRFVTDDQPIIAAVVVIALVIINIVYFRAGNLPAKYIIPGLIFLLVFQVFVICFSVFVSLTNYGSGHNIEKPAAVGVIEANSVARVPGSQAYPVTVLEKEGELYLLATAPNGEALLGSATVPLEPAPDAVFDGDQAKSIPGYTTLTLGDLLRNQEAVTTLQVPLGASAADGYLKTVNGLNAYTFTSTVVYSPETDTMRDVVTGTEYADNGAGNFESTDGDILQPGWKTFVGLQNYATAVGAGGQTDIIGVVVWTFAFALMSVFLSFAVGTFLALVFNDARLRGRRVYRLVMILPYAFPVFLTGLINEVLLGGVQIPWLQDEWLARLTVILVSVWFGAPYFFLVCTGALQSIPDDVLQAAQMDGVTPWQLFRHIKLPLLLVAVSPLLIAAFAFSFNDFTTIFMLSGGGPANPTSPIGAGATDILITVVYKLAFQGDSKDYGLASAFSTLIFLIVIGISVVLFRRTKSLEDVY